MQVNKYERAAQQESVLPGGYGMNQEELKKRLKGCEKVLIGLGEEWKLLPEQSDERREQISRAYQALYDLIKDKDYFIITMATDAKIYDTSLGSSLELAEISDQEEQIVLSCQGADEEMLARLDRVFPKKEVHRDSRRERIVAPCGNETWRQCSLACTKDIWEPGEIPDDICPHCGAPLTGNTMKAQVYIEEGYLPQWERYTRWLAGTLNRETMILELGAGFGSPGIIRFPFEKTAYLNQKAFFCRVHRKFPQIIEELAGRSAGILQDSVEWMAAYCLQGICEQ